MNIKKIREQALLTQTEFAKEIGVGIASVQRWEQKNDIPSFRLKRKILDFCKKNNIEVE